MKDFHIIIPARYNSSRFPGKMLADIAGKPLIQRTYECALESDATSVTIATDDDRIESAARSFGANVCRTSSTHLTGTDRLAEAVHILALKPDEIVVNLQGDEPLVPIKAIHLAANAMEEYPEACTTTLCTPIRQSKQLFDPNVVKVVFDIYHYALYFSRSPIPFVRNEAEQALGCTHYRHLGLYAYRVHTLQQYTHWKPAPMELLESIEPLRILWQGEKIHVSVVEQPLPQGVDIPGDLEAVRGHFLSEDKIIYS